MPALDRFKSRLTPPTPGTGFHSWVMSECNLGVLAGLDPEKIHDELRQAVLTRGIRRTRLDGEIRDALNKALHDHHAGTYTPRPRPEPIIKDGRAALEKIISQGKYSDEADLIEASPVRIWGEP